MASDFVGAGWAFPLEFSPNGSFALSRGTAKLEQAMRLVLGTSPGERPMRPAFGCRLREFVFRGATLDNRSAVADEVRNALAFWEPRVTVDDVAVYPDESNEGLLHIDIGYTVKTTNDRRNLVYPLYTIPDHEGED